VAAALLVVSCAGRGGDPAPDSAAAADGSRAQPPASQAAAAAEAPGAFPPASDVWPQFRGRSASGVADHQGLPTSWDGETGDGIRWKTRIPGLAHSSPVVWGDRVFVTSAVNESDDSTFKPGLYGSGDAADDRVEHRWIVMALDRGTGEVVWERTARVGVPIDKRHIKATYANSTPATDGRFVAAMFGSEGLYLYDLEGELMWSKDLGRLDAGAYDAPSYEWGSASSPIFHQDLVIVQCDVQGDSFLLAADVKTGETVWRVSREEPPSWGTPTVVPWPGGDVLVTNGSNAIRGYDPASGESLWQLGGSSNITAPTPVFDEDGLVVVASGRRPEKPIFAIRPGARGDISLDEGETSNEWVAWSWTRRGPYMPTPVIYRGQLYVLNNDGVFASYSMKDGTEIYRERVTHGGSGFSASPVASDGRIFLPGEDGDVFAVTAGREFVVETAGSVPETVMATPAIAGETMFIRARDHLYAVGR
jgi:outer membrane protein assembly factor BamB